jgi:hypothetical protein
MTEEEKKVADAAALAEAEAKKVLEDTGAVVAEKDAKIAKLEEERDNYKAVALKRLGKLPNDGEFLSGDDDEKKEMSVAEQIRLALLDKEIESEKKAKEDELKRIIKENGELKLALKNRPDTSLGGDSGSVVEVKDNVFTADQINEMKKRATRLHLDPDKYIENAKRNFNAHR